MQSQGMKMLGAAMASKAPIQKLVPSLPKKKSKKIQLRTSSKDNRITNRMVRQGKLPKSQLEIYPQR